MGGPYGKWNHDDEDIEVFWYQAYAYRINWTLGQPRSPEAGDFSSSEFDVIWLQLQVVGYILPDYRE